MAGPVRQEIKAVDGQDIVARFFLPEREATAAALIVPAMGVNQDYYRPFAEWLSRQGFLVGTFDYRGTGLSLSSSLRGFKADIFDWARLDCGAMLEAISVRAPGKRIYWIGHSLGAQILPFVPNRDRISKVVTIAAGSGYWRENSLPIRWRVWWIWYVVAPIAVRVFGYFPGRRLRKVGDLPRGVMDQWRRWCLSPEYAVSAEGEGVRRQYEEVRTPIVSLSFFDDEFMSARNTESLHGFYANAPRVMKRIAPREIGASRIGHFGFFKSAFEPTLWRQYLLPELR